ncbi:hypothetical protein CONPUDRAFT_165854 [Coniophora puteana RWD-64-598 SS2]|uniref:Uncharacterized protein n=1 Tax=Coniophora puteana (strain RWD-64-598) TaxID=741705 RepID=A0A5M3MNI3_CONPW|nr:uncharacterized protein CONPUDRAFT_165854 [Coniophora puteana RWD-64-598 SS2]EIW80285.1 hypothetical protein CONPUDRAFT_165854 [Coniophora puteana RWD-64-598 SS2]
MVYSKQLGKRTFLFPINKWYKCGHARSQWIHHSYLHQCCTFLRPLFTPSNVISICARTVITVMEYCTLQT